MPAGMLVGEGVIQAVTQHAVIDFSFADSITPAATPHQVGGLVHVLIPPATAVSTMPSMISLRLGRDCLSPRVANAVNGQRRYINRQAAMDRGLPGSIHLVAGLDHIAINGGVNFRVVEL